MKKLRIVLSFALLCITIAIFGYYLAHHTNLLHQLMQTNPLVIVALLVCYSGITLSLAAVLSISVRLCNKNIEPRASLGVTITSSIANFFGPLQSGIGIRTIYLKKRLGVNIKNYALVTLYYFGFYAVWSGLLLVLGSPKFRVPLAILLVGGSVAVALVIKKQSKNLNYNARTTEFVGALGASVAAQVVLTALAYFIELSASGAHVTPLQAVSYTGAANFALFVAIAPGAIGIREAFLVFSQKLHQISVSHIVSASILDRAVYVLFLLIALLIVWATHTKDNLQLTPSEENNGAAKK